MNDNIVAIKGLYLCISVKVVVLSPLNSLLTERIVSAYHVDFLEISWIVRAITSCWASIIASKLQSLQVNEHLTHLVRFNFIYFIYHVSILVRNICFKGRLDSLSKYSGHPRLSQNHFDKCTSIGGEFIGRFKSFNHPLRTLVVRD